MTSELPLRLLGHINGEFIVFDPRSHQISDFDILSYTWGQEVTPYNCDIRGVDWPITIAPQKLEDIKRLMIRSEVQYLWVDCVCLNQANQVEKDTEIAKMFQYYKYARRCHILVDMTEVWNPQDIVNDLKFLDHVLTHMRGAALASEAVGLTENMIGRLSAWSEANWSFPMDKMMAKSAAIDLGVLNCYATCINHVKSLFANSYFSRVWTFQEMILGKNIIMWGINRDHISCIGELHIWNDLATDVKDKAIKLREWIQDSRRLNTSTVKAILRIIEEDSVILNSLQIQVEGMNSARTDIINGGPYWWCENHKGVSNIFSAISMRPRECKKKPDIFKGLLGIFNGLFTDEEIRTELGGEDLEKISFAFFKQLSTKTGRAWTRLAIGSKERQDWNWIPAVDDYEDVKTTDCFASVVNLGRLKEKGQAKTGAMTGLLGTPRKYMRIRLMQGNGDYQFIFRGCNCGKKLKTGLFKKSELIPTYDQPKTVARDETGRTLVQCATILGGIMDPGCSNLADYRQRLLTKLRPIWTVSDPNAKPMDWIDRCVSGTFWENPDYMGFRTHNMSMNYRMVDIIGCASRLANGSTANIMCEVNVNCGCTIVAPFSLIFEAITAVEGSSLGDTTAWLDDYNRIVIKDGLGLVQVGDVGKTFTLVSFGGDIESYRSYASSCRTTKIDTPVVPKLPWPTGRALVREEFDHSMTDMTRDYGFVDTEGSGNLLICRKHPMDPYKIVGVCVDEYIQNKKGAAVVKIR
ncbi:hypothetical protein HJFPF1_02085 [Paramyrothecium foliicola]|nr:hypothetical protein HJFPF1_02085 [Paramyrothecium foliicola]